MRVRRCDRLWLSRPAGAPPALPGADHSASELLLEREGGMERGGMQQELFGREDRTGEWAYGLLRVDSVDGAEIPKAAAQPRSNLRPQNRLNGWNSFPPIVGTTPKQRKPSRCYFLSVLRA